MSCIKIFFMTKCGKLSISHSFLPLSQKSQSVISRINAFCTAAMQHQEQERDPAPFFFNKEVQRLLKSMTGRDYEKIFRRRKDSSKITTPKYKFLTDKQLQESLLEVEQKAERLLQMPPVIKKRKEINSIISKDPALQGFETSKLVFTDITFGTENKDRLIVVREPNGILRHANWDERHRMNQIYFPIEGRELFTPQMFEKEQLEDLLRRKEYLFILDRACIQMEPDDPKYQEVTQSVHECINKEGDWDILKSTRHFGPMVFHLAWNENIADLFLHNIQKERIEDNVYLIHLYRILHPKSKYKVLQYQNDDVEFIEDFVNIEFPQSKILSALRSYKELVEERRELEKNIKKAHGLDE